MPTLLFFSERSEDESMPCQAARTLLQLLLVALSLEETGSWLQLRNSNPETRCSKHLDWISKVLEIDLKSRLALCTCTHLLEFCFSDFSSKCEYYFPPYLKLCKLLQIFMPSIIMWSVFYTFFSWYLQILLWFFTVRLTSADVLHSPVDRAASMWILTDSEFEPVRCSVSLLCVCQSVCLSMLFNLPVTFCLA